MTSVEELSISIDPDTTTPPARLHPNLNFKESSGLFVLEPDEPDSSTLPGSHQNNQVNRRQLGGYGVGLALTALGVTGGLLARSAVDTVSKVDTSKFVNSAIALAARREASVTDGETIYQDDIPGDMGTSGFSRLFDFNTLSQISDTVKDEDCVISVSNIDADGRQMSDPCIIFREGELIAAPISPTYKMKREGGFRIPIDHYPQGEDESVTISFNIGTEESEQTRRFTFTPDYQLTLLSGPTSDIEIYAERNAELPGPLQSSILNFLSRVPIPFQQMYLREGAWSKNGKLFTVSHNSSPVLNAAIGYLDEEEGYKQINAAWGEMVFKKIVSDPEGLGGNSIGSFLEAFAQIERRRENHDNNGSSNIVENFERNPYMIVFNELDKIFKPYRIAGHDKYYFTDPQEEFGRLLTIMMNNPEDLVDLQRVQETHNPLARNVIPTLAGSIWNTFKDLLTSDDNPDGTDVDLFQDGTSNGDFSRWATRI